MTSLSAPLGPAPRPSTLLATSLSHSLLHLSRQWRWRRRPPPPSPSPLPQIRRVASDGGTLFLRSGEPATVAPSPTLSLRSGESKAAQAVASAAGATGSNGRALPHPLPDPAPSSRIRSSPRAAAASRVAARPRAAASSHGSGGGRRGLSGGAPRPRSSAMDPVQERSAGTRPPPLVRSGGSVVRGRQIRAGMQRRRWSRAEQSSSPVDFGFGIFF